MKIKQIKFTLYFITALLPVFVILLLAFTTSIAGAQGLAPPPTTDTQYTGNIEGNPIMKWIEFFVNVLSVVIVAGSAVMIAFAGVQYTAARDNPQQVQAAKQRMWNVGIGLVAYFFLYAFIQWIIPGGVF